MMTNSEKIKLQFGKKIIQMILAEPEDHLRSGLKTLGKSVADPGQYWQCSKFLSQVKTDQRQSHVQMEKEP